MKELAPPDLAELAAIEQELARGGGKLRFADLGLEARYVIDRQLQSRPTTRITLALLVICFDLFFIGDLVMSPTLITLSGAMRFGLLTPLLLLFILLDRRGLLGRAYDPLLAAMVMLPTLMTAAEIPFVASRGTVVSFAQVPLIQLSILTCRLDARDALLASAASSLIDAWMVFAGSFILPTERLSMLLTNLAVTIMVMAFAVRTAMRDRQIFLFSRQAAAQRNMLADQNTALQSLARIDALTGLGNRRSFDETLRHVWADCAARQTTVTLVMFDIDHFKHFNDAFGHQAGDDCLATVARAASDCVRNAGDRLARYGGEEFAVILPATSLQDGCVVAERLRTAIMAQAVPHPCIGFPGIVTVSLGIASLRADTAEPTQLIEQADRCLYAAKRAGRNRFALDSDPMPGPSLHTPDPLRTPATQGA